MELVFEREQCLDLQHCLRREWLECNGRGGYASASILDANTRKYHGLLVLALAQPPGRFVLLAKMESALQCQGQVYELSVNCYPGAVYPHGFWHLQSFQGHEQPTWCWNMDGVILRRSLMLVHGQDTVLLRYELVEAPAPVTLRLRPALAYRDYHCLTHENAYLNGTVSGTGDVFHMTPYQGLPPLYFDAERPTRFVPSGYWLRQVEYPREQERGLECHEDLYCPGEFEFQLEAGADLIMRVGIAAPVAPAREIWQWENRRRLIAAREHQYDDRALAALKANAERFLVRNTRGELSVIAGYPWFGEWGRDTMISLPGLTFFSEREAEGFEVLRTYASYERDGLLPNYLNPGNEGHAYNSIDASLWFFWAVQMYLERQGDPQAVRRDLLPALDHVVAAYLEGKVPHAQLDDDGLIWAGDENTQLTWMDARVNGRPVTPRHGLAVEINALWYNALSFYLEFHKAQGLPFDLRAKELRQMIKEVFAERFWLEDEGYLADVVNHQGPDHALRPNQLFALSLPYSALDRRRMRSVVKQVKASLVTPYGLRTLAPGHPAYRGRYEGGPDERDGAYHQGTVWPWLVGHFAGACLRVAADPAEEKRWLRQAFEPLYTQHLHENGLLGISEVFDGDEPQRPEGCIAQAWSVAEVIRMLEMTKE